MRRQSLRPRQIDIHSKLLVVRSEDDLVVEDENGSSLPIATLDELSTIVEDIPQKPKRKKNIPIPVSLFVNDYNLDVPDDFGVPSSYIRFQNIPQEGEDDKVEIDIEKEDMEWLLKHPKYGETGDPRYQLSLDMFEQMLDILEKATGMIHPNLVSLGEAEDLFSKKLHIDRTPQNRVVLDIYNYWVQRRQKLKKPLLRRYWPATPCSDTNPHLVFRPREKERYKLRKHRKNEMDGLRKMQQLKQDFDQMRSLIYLIRKREKAKRILIDVINEILDQTLYELTDKSGKPREQNISDFDRRFNTSNLSVEDERALKRSKKKHKTSKRNDDYQQRIDRPTDSSTDEVNTLQRDADTSFPTFMNSSPTNLSPKNGKFNQFPFIDLLQRSSPHRPLFKCRGRIGRGGRVLIDRIPFQSSKKILPQVYAQPSLFDLGYITSFTKEGSSSPSSSSQSLQQTTTELEGNDLNASTIFIPYDKLQEIYDMTDSEDEYLDPSSSSNELFSSQFPSQPSDIIVKYKFEL